MTRRGGISQSCVILAHVQPTPWANRAGTRLTRPRPGRSSQGKRRMNEGPPEGCQLPEPPLWARRGRRPRPPPRWRAEGRRAERSLPDERSSLPADLPAERERGAQADACDVHRVTDPGRADCRACHEGIRSQRRSRPGQTGGLCKEAGGRKADQRLPGGAPVRARNAMQLKARVNARVQEAGIPAQAMMQEYLFERLLERLPLSPWRDNVVVKGGMLISSLIGVASRTTMSWRRGHNRAVGACGAADGAQPGAAWTCR